MKKTGLIITRTAFSIVLAATVAAAASGCGKSSVTTPSSVEETSSSGISSAENTAPEAATSTDAEEALLFGTDDQLPVVFGSTALTTSSPLFLEALPNCRIRSRKTRRRTAPFLLQLRIYPIRGPQAPPALLRICLIQEPQAPPALLRIRLIQEPQAPPALSRLSPGFLLFPLPQLPRNLKASALPKLP